MISLTSPTETWAHRVPAWAKLAGLSVATVALFALDDPVGLAVAGLAVAGLYATGGLRFAAAGFAGIRMLWPFLLLIAVWHGLTGQIEAGFTVALRLLAALALANFVTMTTRLGDMVAVASFLLAPFRQFGLSTRALELSIALVVRFTPAVAQKGRLLGEAWRARSPRRVGWQIVIPMAAAAIDDAEHVADALKARGGLVPPETNR